MSAKIDRALLPVYFCHVFSRDPGRREMAERCLARWKQEPGVRVVVLTPRFLKCGNERFQMLRRIWPETRRTNRTSRPAHQFHVVADDDCLPPEHPFALECLRILRNHITFGVLSLRPDNAKINRWTPPAEVLDRQCIAGQVYEDDEVQEHYSVGGIRFTRCRALPINRWPEFIGPGYDREHSEALRQHGWRVGFYQKFCMTHLGEGHSIVWRKPKPFLGNQYTGRLCVPLAS